MTLDGFRRDLLNGIWTTWGRTMPGLLPVTFAYCHHTPLWPFSSSRLPQHAMARGPPCRGEHCPSVAVATTAEPGGHDRHLVPLSVSEQWAGAAAGLFHYTLPMPSHQAKPPLRAYGFFPISPTGSLPPTRRGLYYHCHVIHGRSATLEPPASLHGRPGRRRRSIPIPNQEVGASIIMGGLPSQASPGDEPQRHSHPMARAVAVKTVWRGRQQAEVAARG